MNLPLLSVLLTFILATPGEKVMFTRDFTDMDRCFAAGQALGDSWGNMEAGNGITFKPFWTCIDLEAALEDSDMLPSDLAPIVTGDE